MLAGIADLDRPEAPDMIELAQKLSTMYEDFLDDFQEDKAVRDPGIHASEIVACIRKSFYCLTEVEKKSSPGKTWTKRFEVGHALHEMVQTHFRRMAKRENAKKYAQTLAKMNGWHLTFEPEVKVAPHLQELAAHYRIYSSCDGVFTFRLSPESPPFLRVGLEIKTEAPDGYEKLKSPKLTHLEQMHVYMAALDLPLAWFFYFNKGNQNSTPSTGPWLIRFDMNIWAKLESRINVAFQAAIDGVEPPREEGMHCEFCSWSYACGPKYLDRNKPRSIVSVRRSGP
jgi:hypothetical protein